MYYLDDYYDANVECLCTFVGRKTTVTASEIAHTPEVPVKHIYNETKLGVVGFLLCVAGILTFGIFPNLMPSFNVDGEQVKVTMTEIVQFFMYLSVAINLLMMKINTSDILSSNIASTIVLCSTPGWLGATVFNAPQNLKIIQDDITKTSIPWLVIVLVAIVAMIVISQTASLHYGADCHEYGYSTNVFHCNGPNA